MVLLLQGCGIYSFSGISLPPDAKTFSLSIHTDVASGPAGLAAKFQQRLSDELVQRTKLKRTYTQGDIQLEGGIKRFTYMPVALTQRSQEGQASMVRLMIEVELTYVNPYDEEAAFDKKTFTQSADIFATANKNSEESRLIDTIFAKLIEDIFNETIASW